MESLSEDKYGSAFVIRSLFRFWLTLSRYLSSAKRQSEEASRAAPCDHQAVLLRVQVSGDQVPFFCD